MEIKRNEWERNIKHDKAWCIKAWYFNPSADTQSLYNCSAQTSIYFSIFVFSYASFLTLSVSLGLTGFTALPSPPPALSLRGRVRAGRGLLSLLRRPDSAMSTPLSSLSVCPLSESWDRVDPAAQTHTQVIIYSKVEEFARDMTYPFCHWNPRSLLSSGRVIHLSS